MPIGLVAPSSHDAKGGQEGDDAAQYRHGTELMVASVPRTLASCAAKASANNAANGFHLDALRPRQEVPYECLGILDFAAVGRFLDRHQFARPILQRRPVYAVRAEDVPCHH